MLSQNAAARFEIPGYELVYTAPVETALQADDLRNTAEVWQQMFDAAKTRIDLGQFYVANQQGSLLDGVKRLKGGKMTTESVVMRASSGTVRWVRGEHHAD